jgi:hypothetical protein
MVTLHLLTILMLSVNPGLTLQDLQFPQPQPEHNVICCKAQVKKMMEDERNTTTEQVQSG